MSRKLFLWACIVILLATAAFAATTATIISDGTAPACTSSVAATCNVLNVSADSGKAVIYTVTDAEPDTDYTVSFMYKIKSGQFDFEIDGTKVKSLNEVTWKLYTTSFRTKTGTSPVTVKLGFKASGGAADFLLDEIQMVAAPEYTKFNDFKYEVGCCPWDFCYTGGLIEDHPSCIHDDFYEKNASYPPIGYDLADFGGSVADPGTFLDAPSGFRCINGTWKFSRPKLSPMADAAGYCPLEDQCFLGGKKSDVASACVPNGTYWPYTGATGGQTTEYFYCYMGNWTTRTKAIALQLLDFTTTSDTYTLFCDSFDRSLNPDLNMSYYRDFLGDNIVTALSSEMVNEFCVMDLNGQIIAGVSLNMPINESFEDASGCVKGGILCLDSGKCYTSGEKEGCLKSATGATAVTVSFIELLKGPDDDDYCDDVVEAGENNFTACDGQDVYYNANLTSVIFTKPTQTVQSVPFQTEKSFIEVIFETLRDILRNLLGIGGLAESQLGLAQKSNLDFIKKAGSFDKLYVSFEPSGPNSNPREIRAIRETRAYREASTKKVKYRTFISAEYRNYQVDVCRFFYRHNYDDVRNQISDESVDNIQCTPVIIDDDEWMHSIYVEEPVFEDIPTSLYTVRIWKGASDTFWNDITAKIRNQPYEDLGGSAPSSPEFTTEPSSDPVVGTPINFSVTSADSDLVAYTYDFGDGNKSSSYYNITMYHEYGDTGDYDVQLCVMNKYFQITCGSEETLSVALAPQVAIKEKTQTQSRNLTVDLVITGGNSPFNIEVDWGDGKTNDTTAYTKTTWTVSHEYSSSYFSSSAEYDTEKFWINVSAHDRDVAFENEKQVVVYSGTIS
ncbi:PKD domain-containing protein [Candidatus Woesearchaeota archaeon]|nr:PKD domain-containing protein [Candidatus Woesearchaeota archaeon]